MILKELLKMNKNDIVYHKKLGKCRIKEIKYSLNGGFFGVVLNPLTLLGCCILFSFSESFIISFLEDKIRNITTEKIILNKFTDDKELLNAQIIY